MFDEFGRLLVVNHFNLIEIVLNLLIRRNCNRNDHDVLLKLEQFLISNRKQKD